MALSHLGCRLSGLGRSITEIRCAPACRLWERGRGRPWILEDQARLCWELAGWIGWLRQKGGVGREEEVAFVLAASWLSLPGGQGCICLLSAGRGQGFPVTFRLDGGSQLFGGPPGPFHAACRLPAGTVLWHWEKRTGPSLWEQKGESVSVYLVKSSASLEKLASAAADRRWSNKIKKIFRLLLCDLLWGMVATSLCALPFKEPASE